MSAAESYANAGALNSGNSAPAMGSPAPAVGKKGGRRGKRSAKKLRLVKKRTVRRMLKGMGLKMRGGEGATGTTDDAEAPGEDMSGGRRRRTGRKGKKSRRSRKVFGLF
jgi:hypothetical protein